MTGTLALGLIFATASCGSDEKESNETTATVAVAESVAEGETEESMAGDAAAGELTPTQAQVLAQLSADVVAAGSEPDVECLTAVVVQLSEEDAQAVIDAGPGGDPELSEEGKALAPEIEACVPELSGAGS